MPLSRSTKISLLLAVDVVFFFVEIIVGYVVGSLALVADSFHMLNDVMSLIVALYAIKLSKSEASPKYSYGWHRAEIVAALINGVFLLALCFSILMEAIQRFFSKPDISNPKLVVIVGSLGLASNFLGLFLFHEHAHSHEGHAKTKPLTNGKVTASPAEPTLPITADHIHPKGIPPPQPESDSFDQLYGYPAATRASVVQAAQDIGYGRSISPVSHRGPISITHDASLSVPSLSEARRRSADTRSDNDPEHGEVHRDEAQALSRRNSHVSHLSVEDESQPSGKQQHTAAHGSMNMRALILHVIGDALGNVGVIASGLIIWLSTWEHRAYSDPVISLVITVIIFSSALPLVRSASFILLQAVPATISLQDLREDIQKVNGVLSVHELHVWQLSETKIVASVHVWVTRKKEYMHIAQEIRVVLHEHGVHSSTIQPEFHDSRNGSPEERLITTQETHCLIPCPPGQDCAVDNACCPPPKPLIDI